MVQVFGYTHALHRRLELPRFPFAGLWLKLLMIGLLQATLLWFCRPWADGWWSLLMLGDFGWMFFYLCWIFLRFSDEGDRDILRRLWAVTCLRIRNFMFNLNKGA